MAERCQPLSPIIELAGVTKFYEAKRALDRVTVTIQPGEFVAVIGKSGAGKTALLRCLTCSTTVSEGRIRAATAAGLTIIANLHHVDYARRYADRVLGLRGGQLVYDGAPTALTETILVEIFGDVPTATPKPDPMAVGEAIWAIS